jgi:hypothetical protein
MGYRAAQSDFLIPQKSCTVREKICAVQRAEYASFKQSVIIR